VVKSNFSYRGADEREMGFRAVMAEARPGIEVITLDIGTGEDRTAEAALAGLLPLRPDICAVYNTGGSIRGIGQALMAAGRSDAVFVSHDLGQAAREFLLDGVLDAVITQSPRDEAECAIAMALRLAGPSEKTRGQGAAEILPVSIILKECLT